MSHIPHDPVRRLNDHHAEELLAVARAFGAPDATAARATRVHEAGVELVVDSPRGAQELSVAFPEPVTDGPASGTRRAFVALAREARSRLG